MSKDFNIIEMLNALEKLKESGLISAEEYVEKKANIMSQNDKEDGEKALDKALKLGVINQEEYDDKKSKINESEEVPDTDNILNLDCVNIQYLQWKEFVQLHKDDALLGITEHAQKEDIVLPFMYPKSSSTIHFNNDDAFYGLPTLFSFDKTVCFCLEHIARPKLSKHQYETSSITQLLEIKREDIIGFNFNKFYWFNEQRLKISDQIANNISKIKGWGIIPSIILNSTASLTGSFEKNTKKTLGILFTLNFNRNNIIHSLSLACNQSIAPALYIFLKNHWINLTPKAEDEDTNIYNRDNTNIAWSNFFDIGDLVTYMKWTWVKGFIKEKYKTEAVVERTTNSGEKKTEHVKYSNLYIITEEAWKIEKRIK